MLPHGHIVPEKLGKMENLWRPLKLLNRVKIAPKTQPTTHPPNHDLLIPQSSHAHAHAYNCPGLPMYTIMSRPCNHQTITDLSSRSRRLTVHRDSKSTCSPVVAFTTTLFCRHSYSKEADAMARTCRLLLDPRAGRPRRRGFGVHRVMATERAGGSRAPRVVVCGSLACILGASRRLLYTLCCCLCGFNASSRVSFGGW